MWGGGKELQKHGYEERQISAEEEVNGRVRYPTPAYFHVGCQGSEWMKAFSTPSVSFYGENIYSYI